MSHALEYDVSHDSTHDRDGKHECQRVNAEQMLDRLRFVGSGVECPCCDGCCACEDRDGDRWVCTLCYGAGRLDWDEWLDTFVVRGGFVPHSAAGPCSAWPRVEPLVCCGRPRAFIGRSVDRPLWHCYSCGNTRSDREPTADEARGEIEHLRLKAQIARGMFGVSGDVAFRERAEECEAKLARLLKAAA